MTLSDLASIGSFVSALAVLVSLGFLSLQMQQANRNQQASIRAARASRSVDLFMGAADPLVAEAVLKGMQGSADITETQVFQFRQYATARFFNAEDTFYQHREGLLNAYYLEGVTNGMRSSFAHPGMRWFYRGSRSVFGQAFVAYADAVLAETPVAPEVEGMALFKAGVAAERAGAAG